MTIYSSNRDHRKYRKIYEQHHGAIPKDEFGRSYDIHHIDGDCNNNTSSNLIAVSKQEHLKIHYSQGDYFAAWKIAQSLNKTKEELSEISRLHAKKLVEKGTHNFQKRTDGTSLASDRVQNGSHHLLGGDIQRRTNKKRIKDGTHNCNKKGKEAPRYDHRIFCFSHKDGRTFVGTQNEFRQANTDVYSGHLSRLLNGKLKSTKGWSVAS